MKKRLLSLFLALALLLSACSFALADDVKQVTISIVNSSSDYFPIFPQLGWFLLGAALGRTVYREKQTLLPCAAQDFFLIRFFRWCGRQSLWIYLAHQPVVYGILELIVFLKQ